MQFFYWNSSYEVGVARIDEQHQKLIDLINNLGSAITTEIEIPKLEILIEELRDYIDFHFRDEERLFEQSDMPEKEQKAHKAKHATFASKVDKVLGKKDLTDAGAAEEVFDFLVTWLVQHILVVDRAIPQYLENYKKSESDGCEEEDDDGSDIALTLIYALNECEKRFRLLSDNAPVMIWITDDQGRRIFHNRGWSDFIGENVKGNDKIWFDIIHPEDRSAYKKYFTNLIENPEKGDFEYRARNQNGEYCYFMERVIPRREQSGTFMGLASSTVDITSLKNAEELLMQANITLEIEVEKRTEEIRELLLTDTLTKTKNRRFLMDQLKVEMSRGDRYGSPLSLVFFDIDHFKKVNDEFGHRTGDHVLSFTAATMTRILRDCDQLCRYGGEEFIAILPETNLENAQVIAERILEIIRKTTVPETGKTMTVSAGVGQWKKGESRDDFLERCDRAMYLAKKNGRDQICLAEYND